MEINNNRHNIFSSTIAPNPLSVKYWADLNADPNGGVIKFWDNTKWKDINDNSASTSELADIKESLNKKVDKVEGMQLTEVNFTADNANKLKQLTNYNDAAVRELISNLSIKLGALEDRIAALENPIV